MRPTPIAGLPEVRTDSERTEWREERARLVVEIDGLRAERDAERARAARAEQGWDAERARTDALRDRLDDAQSQITAADEATRQPHAEMRAAQDDATQLRQVVAADRARGRLRRVLAALRGQ
jgi:hypothetical protein